VDEEEDHTRKTAAIRDEAVISDLPLGMETIAGPLLKADCQQTT